MGARTALQAASSILSHTTGAGRPLVPNVFVTGDIEVAGPLSSTLASCAIPITSDLAKAGAIAAAAQDEGDSHLREMNTAALRHGLVSLPILRFDGYAATVGPLCIPNQTACYECLRARLVRGKALDNSERNPSLDILTAAAAARVIVRYFGQGDRYAPGRCLSIYPSGAIHEGFVYPMPRCPACAEGRSEVTPDPWAP
jgi:hypothetical protein